MIRLLRILAGVTIVGILTSLNLCDCSIANEQNQSCTSGNSTALSSRSVVPTFDMTLVMANSIKSLTVDIPS